MVTSLTKEWTNTGNSILNLLFHSIWETKHASTQLKMKKKKWTAWELQTESPNTQQNSCATTEPVWPFGSQSYKQWMILKTHYGWGAACALRSLLRLLTTSSLPSQLPLSSERWKRAQIFLQLMCFTGRSFLQSSLLENGKQEVLHPLRRDRNESGRIRNELLLHPPWGHTGKRSLLSNQHLKMPLSTPPAAYTLVHWLCAKLRMGGLSLQITWKAGTWSKFV